jgi:BMFP domain-containing protein YqiC
VDSVSKQNFLAINEALKDIRESINKLNSRVSNLEQSNSQKDIDINEIRQQVMINKYVGPTK